MTREIIFTIPATMNRKDHVVVTMDDGDTVEDAIEVFRAHRPDDWELAEVSGGEHERRIFRSVKFWADERAREAEREAVAAAEAHRRAAFYDDLFRRLENSPRVHYHTPHVFAAEPDIPHNWGIGDGDLLDHLDAATRYAVKEAIFLNDETVDEMLYGSVDDFDVGTLPTLPQYLGHAIKLKRARKMRQSSDR